MQLFLTLVYVSRVLSSEELFVLGVFRLSLGHLGLSKSREAHL